MTQWYEGMQHTESKNAARSRARETNIGKQGALVTVNRTQQQMHRMFTLKVTLSRYMGLAFSICRLGPFSHFLACCLSQVGYKTAFVLLCNVAGTLRALESSMGVDSSHVRHHQKWQAKIFERVRGRSSVATFAVLASAQCKHESSRSAAHNKAKDWLNIKQGSLF